MGLHDNISGLAVMIYIFIFLIIMNARRTSIRDIFLSLIGVSILWTGGSLFMRTQTFPGYEFWYHISLLGIFLMPVVYFRFIMEYSQNVRKDIIYMYLVIMGVSFLINLFTGLVIPPPIIEVINGVETMVYKKFNNLLFVLFGFGVIMIIQMIYWLYRGIRSNPIIRRIGIPVVIGIVSIFIGNVLIMFPLFSKFPIDIVAGLVNAVAILYALTMKSPFKLRMATSEPVGYATCLFLGFLSLMILYPSINALLLRLDVAVLYWSIVYILVFSVFLVTYFYAYRRIIIGVFVKEDDEKTALLNHYSSMVTATLSSKKIFTITQNIIREIIGEHRVSIALFEKDELSVVSAKLLKNSVIKDTIPLQMIKDELRNKSYINMADFKLREEYRSISNENTVFLTENEVSYIFSINNNSLLSGMLFISDKSSKRKINQNDVFRLQSICTSLSLALRNAASYEQAIKESQTDSLTGLFNRKYFYEKIQEIFSEAQDDCLTMVMFNLDDFKLYNQLYGVKNADQALQTISHILLQHAPENSLVARYSGKEFAIVLPSYDVSKTKEMLTLIKNEMAKDALDTSQGLRKPITASIGICSYPDGADSVPELIENAQQAVYSVKQNGKNNLKVFDTFSQKPDQAKAKSSIYSQHSSTIYALTAAIDAKDRYTFRHSQNVANYAVEFAKRLHLNDEIVENIRQAALLHDIGKIAIPEHILNKPSSLDEEEYEIMKGHVDASIDIIRHLPSLDYVIPAVLGHHEKFDGTGYPRRAKGENIPLTARILCIADAVDAMLSVRAYKSSKTIEQVIKILQEESGKQFDSSLVEEFIELLTNDVTLSKSQTLEFKK